MKRIIRTVCAIASSALVSGCGEGAGASVPSSIGVSSISRAAASRSPIKHIVLMVQEARTFNALFGTVKTAKARVGEGGHTHVITIHLKAVGFDARGAPHDDHAAFIQSVDNGKMDGFYEVNGRAAYTYLKPRLIRQYLAISHDYAVADRLFQTQGSGDFTAHQDLIRGGTEISPKASVIDIPDEAPWDCNAPPGTQVGIILKNGKAIYPPHQALPFPCFTYDTLQTRLDPKRISWKYYTPSSKGVGEFWNAFGAIEAVDGNPGEWKAHISSPETNVLRDIANGTLPAMSWVIPSLENSDAGGQAHAGGPAWVTSVVNAIGQSQYWDSTAIVIVWDDWGGHYDPVPPPDRDDQGGPGLRVPMLVVSPYTPAGQVSHTVYGFGSIVRFVEETFALKPLGTTDETSNSIGEMFDFNGAPRSFERIP